MRKHWRTVALVAGALVLVLCIGLFVRSYRDSGPTSSGGGGGSTEALPTDLALPSASPSRPSPSPTGPSGLTLNSRTLPAYTLTPGEPGGLVIKDLPTHALRLTVSSAAPVGKVGYLVPTSKDHSYGVAKDVGTSWVLTTDVIGKPYYAAVFVQAGAAGVPITCTVTVDGVVTDRKTTSGAYGRQVCLG